MEIPVELLSILQKSRKLVVLTGAGMSAESGVPTFRDAQAGLWAKYRPEDLATPEAFRRQPRVVWDWYAERRENVKKVRPHPGHVALVEMEKYFASMQLVTQNVDGLHQRAGSRDVIELHGNIMHSICSETGRRIEPGWIEANPGRPPVSPHHPAGLARPAVVWFGEMLPEGAMARAMEAASKADVFFSVGTSALVQPAASLPIIASNAGAVVVEINPVATPLSAMADFCMQAAAAEALTAINRSLAATN